MTDELRFKESCDRCAAPLSWVDPAFICASECTYCTECTSDLGHVCPNCSGDLVRRPRRTQPVGPRPRNP